MIIQKVGADKCIRTIENKRHKQFDKYKNFAILYYLMTKNVF